ncbi:hypothetical protein B5G00_08065 [Blautia sp. An46]|nr:hypothetical protein B5G33_03660 [Blautia sp. An81]OUN92708.1 hypothetical protein B5G00_08065 [Blautia sp. An46]
MFLFIFIIRLYEVSLRENSDSFQKICRLFAGLFIFFLDCPLLFLIDCKKTGRISETACWITKNNVIPCQEEIK